MAEGDDGRQFGWAEAAQVVPKRPADGHKGHFGRVAVFAGAPSMPGAALLCLQGALRSGCGRVHWHTDADTLANAVPRPPEVLLDVCEAPRHNVDQAAPDLGYVEAWAAAATHAAQSVAVGPGLGTCERARATLRAVLGAAKHDATPEDLAGGAAFVAPVPACVDADALNLLAAHPDLTAALGPHVVLTPHVVEAARLLGVAPGIIVAQPAAAARRLAQTFGAVVLLKGAPTHVAAPHGAAWTVGGPGQVGGPALAHAGSGDVLCGLVAGLLAQGLAPRDAAAAGAFVHAAAGDVAAEVHGEAGTLPSDVALAVGAVWRRLAR